MTQEQKNVLENIVHYRNAIGRGTSRNTTALTFAEIYASYSLLVQENEKHEKFTRWLIGELIKGELSEEAVMDKLVEFGRSMEEGPGLEIRAAYVQHPGRHAIEWERPVLPGRGRDD